LKAFAIAAITLVVLALGPSMGWHKVMAQVPAPTKTTNLSPALAATVSEAKPTPEDTAPNNSELDSLLRQEGFGVVKLTRENLDNQKAHKNNPKHLILDAEVNRASASLWIDTGTPTTNVARDSLKKFGVVEQTTSYRVTSPLGSASDKFYGIAKLNTLAMGNCVIQDAPVIIDTIPYVDGVLGSEDMHRIGAVLPRSRKYVSGHLSLTCFAFCARAKKWPPKMERPLLCWETICTVCARETACCVPKMERLFEKCYKQLRLD